MGCNLIDGMAPNDLHRGFVQQIVALNLPLHVEPTTEMNLIKTDIPGGTMGPNGTLRLRSAATYFNSGFGAAVIRWRVRWGAVGAVIFDATTPAMGTTARPRAVNFYFMLANRNDEAAQIGGGYWGISTGIAPNVGTGPFYDIAASAGFGTPALLTAPVAEDTAAVQQLRVTVELSGSAVFVDFDQQYVVLDRAFRP